MAKVVMLTTVHVCEDVRIYRKIACSLASFGHDVHLLAPASQGRSLPGVTLHALSPTSGLFTRLFRRQRQAFRDILQLKPSIVHLHDPELLPLGLVLQLMGYKVIFDSHEEVAADILCKHWISPWLRKPVSKLYRFIEIFVTKRLSAVVTPTPKIAALFPIEKTVVLQNFALLSEYENAPESTTASSRFVYIGGLTSVRGILEMVDAIEQSDPTCRLDLGGNFSPNSFRQAVQQRAGWAKTTHHGYVNRVEAVQIMSSAIAGLLTIHPIKSHLESCPNKLFEYFASGIPVIASDFPHWREWIGDDGIFVDPESPKAIAEAMNWFLSNREKAREMGMRGKRRVFAEYNWEREALKLKQLYDGLLAAA